jgi:hypothetical protein
MSIGRVGAVAEDAGLQAELSRIAGLAGELGALDDDTLASWDGVARLLAAGRDTLAAVQGAEAALADPDLAEEAGALGADLAERLLALHLRARHSTAFRALALLGLVVPGDHADPQPMLVADDGTLQRLAWPRDELRPDRLGALVRDAAGYFGQRYLPNGMQDPADAHAGAAALFPLVVDVANLLRLRVLTGYEWLGPAPPDQPDDSDQPELPPFPPPADDEPAPDLGPVDLTEFQRGARPRLGLELPPLPGDPAAPARFGLTLTASSAGHPDQTAGYLLALFGAAGWDDQRGRWRVSLAVDGEVPLLSLGPGGLRLGPGQVPGAAGSATLTLTRVVADGQPALLVGGAGETRLEVGTLTLRAGIDVSATRQAATAALDAGSALLVLASGDDGLLGALLPGNGLRVPFDLGVAIASDTGVHLRGGPGLRLPIETGIAAGPVALNAVTITLHPEDGGLAADVAATLSAQLGPVTAVVDGLGLQLRLAASTGAGALGPVDADMAFLPPSGVGVAVDAPVITGGGFLGRDPATGRYTGALDLHAGEVAVTGLGVLDPHSPQGGYSLVVALRASFPAVQVGFGFALTGVGGLLALNRGVNVDVLRNRLAAGIAGRILAPEDPIRNAPALLADLDAVFPGTPGVTVVGPTVQLLWAGLVHLDVGVFIELPGPARVILLGSAHAEIERDGRAYLRIRVDIVGVVDLRGETAAFDAVLIDSHLMGILDLTGGAAFRLSWGSQPYAVLSLGGFHPAYHPEPLSFPATLTRIAMVHGVPSDELYLRFEGYFAVTSNTLQFGASVEVIINADHFKIHGAVGFDALIQRDPFHFQFDIRASVSVAYHGHTLGGLTLTGSLTGPGPTVVQAKVCIELLFFDICFSGSFPLGPLIPPLLTAAADLLASLLGELDNPATLRAGGAPDPFVRLRPPDPSLTTTVIAPSGTLVWQQQRAPLDLLLTRVGGAPLPAPTQVSATGSAPTTPETDWFAPGQFLDLTDDQALTRPGFEQLSGGLRLAGADVVDGPGAQTPLTIKQIRLPARVIAPQKPVIMFPGWVVTSATGPAIPLITVRPERWSVHIPTGDRSDLTGAQARQLAALTPSARAFPATDRLTAFAF